jgi:hypothetical protein
MYGLFFKYATDGIYILCIDFFISSITKNIYGGLEDFWGVSCQELLEDPKNNILFKNNIYFILKIYFLKTILSPPYLSIYIKLLDK